MENNDKNHNSGNGFLIGVILGSIVTLLFTTKKGREIVKELTEKGLEKVSELQDNIDKAVVVEEVEENDYVAPVDRPYDNQPDKPKLIAAEKLEKKMVENTHTPKPRRSVKRLFRLKKN